MTFTTNPKDYKFRKPTKTISGVTPIAVMLPPRPCKHGACVYCPSLNVPQSYTPESPVVLRAKSVNYDAKKQTQIRLEAFKAMKHPTDKIEIIIMGGTFLDYPLNFQYKFIKGIFDGLNEKISKDLEEAKRINELGKHRCVALCIETRPDVCSNEHIKRMLEFGCTRVELGVQFLDDKSYKLTNRCHTVKDVVDATFRLKEAGFKVGYHLMPGLPGSNIKKDIANVKKIFSDERFKPDQIKIYPCQVIPGAKLEEWYKEGGYKPYTDEEIIKVLIEIKKLVPEYCRIMRIMREIPPSYLVAGTLRIDMRKVVREKFKDCKCIRCREIGFFIRDNPNSKIDENLRLKIIKYKASKGKEYFLQIVNKQNLIFGMLRLRIPYKPIIDELKNSVIIRELHVYGSEINIGQKNISFGQHKGLGRKLMEKAEEIARKEKVKNIAVISGIGVREYYRKLGYELEKFYMTKSL